MNIWRFRIYNWVCRLSCLHVALILALVGLIVYANSLNNGFVDDDLFFIRRNAERFDWLSIFSQRVFDQNPAQIVNTYYRPLLEILYRVQFVWFKFNPFGYHFINVFLHIINSVLVYLVCLRLPGLNKVIALFTSIIFLIHPVQTEAVACISGISNTFFTLLCLSSFLMYCLARYAQRHQIYFYGISLVLFLLSLFSKEQAVILPLLVGFYELCFSDYQHVQSRRVIWQRIGGYFVVLIAYFFLKKGLLGTSLGFGIKFDQELQLRMLAIPQSLITYLKTFFWPDDLHYYRTIDILKPFWPSLLLLFIILAIVIFIITTSIKSQRRLLIFSVTWFLISLLPVLNFVPLVVEYSSILTAEHFLYLPIIGLIIFVLQTADGFIKSRSEAQQFIVTVFISVCIIVSLSVLTVLQNRYWFNEVTLFKRSAKFEANVGRVHVLLAKAHYFNKQYKEAIVAAENALRIMQNYVEVSEGKAQEVYLGFVKGIHFDLAHYFEAVQMFNDALRHYNLALDIDPMDATLHNNLGVIFMRLGQIKEAAASFDQAVKLDSRNISASKNLQSSKEILKNLSKQ